MTRLDATAVAAVLRAVIYARVSTTLQVDGTSLDTQVSRGRAHVDERGLRLVAEPFVEEGVSGSLKSRPKLDQVMRLVEDGEVDVVVVTKLDRIARSLKHLLELLEFFERHHVTLIALDDPVDPSTASGKAMVQLRGVFAELERQLIRERTAEGVARRLSEGCWVGGPAPYGFDVIKNPGGPGRVLAINDDEAMVMRLAYDLIVVKGLTTGEAAEELNYLGSRPRHAAMWTHWNLRRLLLDGRGLSGNWPWRRAGRKRLDAHGNVVVGAPADEVIIRIPAVLNPAEHERLLATLAATSTVRRPEHDRPYLLSRRITSPHGVRMHGAPTHSGKRWYRCYHRHSAHAPDGELCGCLSLHADTIEEAVWEEVLQLLARPEALEAIAESYEATRRPHANRERDQLASIETAIADLEETIGSTMEGLIREGLDPGAIAVAVRRLNDDLVAMRGQRDQLLRLRKKNLAATSLTTRLRTLTEHAADSLATADHEMRSRIFDLLALQVHVTGWETCATCHGNGLLAAGERRRRKPRNEPRRQALMCPDCLRTRHIPTIRIAGEVPEALLVALADDAAITAELPVAGEAVGFETEIRVA